jgi:hypothetical protein
VHWLRFSLLAVAALLLGGAEPPSALPRGWHCLVKLTDGPHAQATVSLTFPAPTTPQVCADMPSAGRFVRDIQQIFSDGRALPLVRDGDCFRLIDAKAVPVRLRYKYDLAAAADHFNNADLVQRHEQAMTFSDEAVLLRPDPLPLPVSPSLPSPSIDVEFELPTGTALTVPWQKLPGPGLRYQLDAAQYDGGSYVTFGAVRPLGTLALAHSQVELHLVGKSRASDLELRTWIEQASRASERLYGPQMPSKVHIVIVAWPGQTELGSFGTVLRPLRPSVLIYFGADATRFPLSDDWVATHEIFHIGNPLMRYKVPWFVEGFTTYYQDILRARLGALTAKEAWSDLWDGFRRHCQPDGTSLETESANLHKTYRYTRVYWGGACLAFLLDVEIRKKSQGKRSLDDVMRSLRKQSLHTRLDEESVLEGLGQASSPALVRRYLRERNALPLRETLTLLGIEPVGDDSVRLRDDAPLSALRRAMF